MRRWIFAALVLANLGLLMWGMQYLEVERPAASETQEPVRPEKMKLVKDSGPKKPREKTPAPSDAAPPPRVDASLISVPVCYRLGPFHDVAQTQKVEAALVAQSLVFMKREEAARTVTGYRVYLPPFPSKDAAERKRRELTKLGFKDHAVMHDEGLDNAISLGLYAVEANAQSHIKRLAQKGVQAMLQSLEQTRPSYWFELAPLTPAPDVGARLGTLLVGISGADAREFTCPASAAVVSPANEPTPAN